MNLMVDREISVIFFLSKDVFFEAGKTFVHPIILPALVTQVCLKYEPEPGTIRKGAGIHYFSYYERAQE